MLRSYIASRKTPTSDHDLVAHATVGDVSHQASLVHAVGETEVDLAGIVEYFDLLAGQLAKVVFYVDPEGKHALGTSWVATDAWKNNKQKLSERPDLLEALHAYSRRTAGGSILYLLLKAVKE